MDGKALGHFQRQGVDLRPIVLGQRRRLATEPLKLAPADPFELLVQRLTHWAHARVSRNGDATA